jgi:2-keto-4-pentenoate hydratase/2-oxohepta-3-ene-1,7-dioic acid hydratase in catechol pathway
VADHGEDIPIPKWASKKLDYEGELVVLIGKDAKDVPAEEALDYVAGFTAGNDVSARDWQRDPELAGQIPQWVYSKSLDKFAPLGPVLVSKHVLGAANNLDLKTFVNGELRQHGNTGDLCFDVGKIIAFFSRGTTLQKGTVIMTGTPGGVGLFMKPTGFLKDGDEVHVKIESIGTLRNRYVFVDK